MSSPVHFVNCLDQFLSDIEIAHRGDYKNPNSPIYEVYFVEILSGSIR